MRKLSLGSRRVLPWASRLHKERLQESRLWLATQMLCHCVSLQVSAEISL